MFHYSEQNNYLAEVKKSVGEKRVLEKYKYSFFAKLIYRYGNIIATLFLSVHFISSIMMMFEKWYFVFFALINGFIIFIVNRYFFKTYRLFPFTVEADNEKIVCRDFLFGRKEITIYHSDIENITGGIFSGYPTRPVYIKDGRQNITIGFYSHVGKFQKLITTILKNIPQPLYDKLLTGMKEMRIERKK